MKLKSGRRPNRVTAVLKTQLAEQVNAVSELHGGLPLSVNVRVAAESNR